MFFRTESDTVSFVVFKLTPPTPSTQVKQSLSIQDHVPLSCWSCVGGMKLRKEPWEKIAWFHPCHHPVAPTFLVQSQGLGDWSHLWLDLGFTLQSCLLVSSLTKPGDSEWSWEYGQQWTCPLRRCHFKRNVVFQQIFFSGLVSFYWGRLFSALSLL